MMGEYDAGYVNYIDELNREIIDYQIEVEQVKGENAKLRELLSELYESACLEYPSAFEHTYGERLRELGVDA